MTLEFPSSNDGVSVNGENKAGRGKAMIEYPTFGHDTGNRSKPVAGTRKLFRGAEKRRGNIEWKR
jgi:hypothetical protein